MSNALLNIFKEGKEWLDSLDDPEEKRRRELREAGPQIDPEYERSAGMNQSPVLKEQGGSLMDRLGMSGDTYGELGYKPPWEEEDDKLWSGELWEEGMTPKRLGEIMIDDQENRDFIAPWTSRDTIRKESVKVMERLAYEKPTDEDLAEIGRLTDLLQPDARMSEIIKMLPANERRDMIEQFRKMLNERDRLKPGGMKIGA